MTERKLCVIGGDGIGPDVTQAAVRVLLAATSDVVVSHADAGWGTFCEQGDSVPKETLQHIRQAGAALFGAVSSPSKKVEGYRSAILKIRQSLNLYANLRPVKGSWHDQGDESIDLLIVRENSEGLYVGKEEQKDGWAKAEKIVTRSASFRIGQAAGKAANQRAAQKVTVVHKANVLSLSDGMFRDAARQALQEEYPQLQVNEGLVDIVAHNLIAQPNSFDVLVTTNLYGDILSDLAAYWCGGMGRAPSINLGDGVAVAEPVHGSAPDIAGQGIADPSATILSLVLLCRHYWNDESLARRMEDATVQTIREFGAKAKDDFSTVGFTDQVVKNLSTS